MVTTNLSNHMKRKHAQFLKTDEPPAKMPNILSSFENSSTKDSLFDDECFIDDGQLPSISMSKSACGSPIKLPSIKPIKSPTDSTPRQPPIDSAFKKISAYADGGTIASKITNALLYMIARDNLPLSTSENKGFKYFVETSIPLYKLPGRTTITKLMDDKYACLSTKLKADFVAIENSVLTTDVWTDTFNIKSFLGLTVHYTNSNFKFKSVVIGVRALEKKHTFEYLSNVLQAFCDEWKIDKNKVTAVVTDNGANIVKTIIDLFGLRKHLPCFAHTINLIVTDFIKTTTDLKIVVDKVKAIVTFFKHSVNVAEELRKLQIKDGMKEGTILKLKQKCETRWNLMYYMLSRFLKLTEYVNTILIRYPKPDMLMQKEVQIIKKIVAILSPLEKITVEMSGDGYVTCSKIIPIVNCLIKTMEKTWPIMDTAKILHENIYNQILKRFYSDESNIEKNKILAISTMLDPRFKKLHFRSPLSVSITIEKICRLMKATKDVTANMNESENSFASTINNDNFWNIHDELVTSVTVHSDEPGDVPVELRQFLNQPVI